MASKRPRVSKSNSNNTNHEISSSQTITETVKGSHVYEIKGYSLTKGMGVGKSMASGRFTVGGYDWVMHFYPDGFTTQAQKEEYVSVFFRLVSPGEVRASFEFKLLDQTGKSIQGVPSKSSRSPHTFKSGSQQWGYTKYMKKSQLETSDYLKDDCLSILCTVGVVQTRGAKGNHYVIHIPPSDMPQNFKGLLESKIGYDITFQVGNEFFRAHKLILAARSPVFRAQFFGLVGNPDMEIVVIKEFDPITFKAMLLFIYSDEFPDCTSTTMAQNLLVAADHYNTARLKLMCEAKLYEDITANTVADTLELADLHNCTELKTACLNFAVKPENLRDVMKSDGYANLVKCHPSLLKDLLQTSAMVDK